jgi:beta-glucosidase
MAETLHHTPMDFGISASSYHIEGGNYNTDWHQFEQEIFKDSPENMCGIAVDYWNQWKSDHELLSELGISIVRTSVEWSRINPEPGVFDEQALQQYREMLCDLKKRNIKVILTLFHYTAPLWFRSLGGFENKKNLKYFDEFVRRTLSELQDCVDIVTPINEIFVYSSLSYLLGYWFPKAKSINKFIRVNRNLLRAHFIVAEFIQEKKYDIKVSTSEHARTFKYQNVNRFTKLVSRFHNFFFNQVVTKSIVRNEFVFPLGIGAQRVTRKPYRPVDYLGVQFYPSVKVKMHIGKYSLRILPAGNNGEWTKALLTAKLKPKDFFLTLKEYKKYGIPILITESGVQTENDKLRMEKLESNIKTIKKARSRGIPVEGYMYFSLFDCFEWAEGYTKKFGLVSIDRQNNLERSKKGSFEHYKNLIQNFHQPEDTKARV